METRSRLLKVGALFVCGVSGCATHRSPQLQLLSGIDARFELARSRATLRLGPTESPGVSFYRSVLGQTLSSHCSYFPSDSAYAQDLHRRCGRVSAIVRSYARFSRESDASELGFPLVPQPDHNLYFKELPDDCDEWI